MTAMTEPMITGFSVGEDGAARVGKSRVLLELVLQAFDDGATPETILQRYDTLRLADVYAVIAHHLEHPEQTREYMLRRENDADQVRARIDKAQGDLAGIRARLLARRTAGG